jgi:hypothetical protein
MVVRQLFLLEYKPDMQQACCRFVFYRAIGILQVVSTGIVMTDINDEINAMSDEQRVELARRIMTMLKSWKVSASDQIRLLAMPDSVRTRSMARYGQDTPLPDEPAVNERVDHLIGIADALRTSFPMNEHMGSIWLNRANKRFANRKPLNVMLDDGLAGVLSIRMHLDCSYDWHVDDSKSRS